MGALRRASLLCVLLGALRPAPATAATYYVDPGPANCSTRNGNPGTSPANPWCNPPGTRNAGNAAFYSTSWGGITASNKVACGDLILLKGGSTQASGQGGAWRIDTNYYRDCGSGSRTTVRVASSAEWSGSSGHFTLDGSGITPTCVTFCGGGGVAALIDVEGVDYVNVGGISDTQRLIVRDSSDSNVLGHSATGLRFQYVESIGAAGRGFSIGVVTTWLITNSLAHDNGASGFNTGLLSNNASDLGGIVDTEAYTNGGNQPGGNADQFNFGEADNLWCVRCISRLAVERGFDMGSVSNVGTSNRTTCRDCRLYDNGTASVYPNVQYWGACASGDDNSGNGREDQMIFQRSIFYRNEGGGGPCAYGQGWAEVWNSLFFRNAQTFPPNGDVTIATGNDIVRLGVFNTIVQRRDRNSWSTTGPSGFGTSRSPVSNFNLFRPNAANSEPLGGGTYASPQSVFGPNDKIGIAHSIGWQSISGNCDGGTFDFNACDFHLTAGSSAIDAGTYMMKANGGGSGTTINVLSNAPGANLVNDPRIYFIGPNSYLDATPDTIQIQSATCAVGSPALSAGRAVIAGMTSTTITLDRACTWANGAGVHLPWAGVAPDMGAFEFGLGAEVGAPTLLSVEPVP